jgi:hypothetical protein
VLVCHPCRSSDHSALHEEKGFLQLPCMSPFLGKRTTNFRSEKIMAENFPLKKTNPQKNIAPRLQDCSKNTNPEIFLPQKCKNISLSCSKITRNLPPTKKICKKKKKSNRKRAKIFYFEFGPRGWFDHPLGP